MALITASIDVPNVNIEPGKQFSKNVRRWQGAPGIERTASGRLWGTWFSGGETEPVVENYIILATSDDDGISWSDPVVVVSPEGEDRAFDPVVWLDPAGRLWWFWAQNRGLSDGVYGVWGAYLKNPDAERMQWSVPRRICNGVMKNRPTVTSNGTWLLPAAIWICKEPLLKEMAHEQFSNVVASYDNGLTFNLIGKADIPDRTHDEHYIVERKDGSLWMLVRTSYGVGQSISTDGGMTWSHGTPSNIKNADSRLFIRRLRSGRLLLVHHDTTENIRNNLTVALSEDDGLTWYGNLMLDERIGVSYPDATEADDGRIFIVYDYNRETDKEILMAVVTEDDIIAGKCVSRTATLKQIISKPL